MAKDVEHSLKCFLTICAACSSFNWIVCFLDVEHFVFFEYSSIRILISHLAQKLNARRIKDITRRSYSLHSVEEKVENIFELIGSEKNCMSRTQIVWKLRLIIRIKKKWNMNSFIGCFPIEYE